MKNSQSSFRKKSPWGISGIFLVSLLISIKASANDDLPYLFTWTTAIVNPIVNQNGSKPEVKRSHVVQLHLERLMAAPFLNGDQKITLNLFENMIVVAVKDRLEKRSLDSYTWFGHIVDLPRSQVILTVEKGAMAGNITLQDQDLRNQKNYQIRPLPEGLYEIREIDQSAFREGGVDESRSDYVPIFSSHQDAPPDSKADDGSLIDVMVLYTDAVAVASMNIAAEIQLGMDETNQSYLNSGINQRVRLAHKAQVSYAETGVLCGGAVNDLDRLGGQTDGYLDQIHAWRDTYAADIVSLWVENGGGSCGCGYLMDNVASGFAEWAFNVTVRSCATGNYSFGHEMGHNMGARHDWYVDSVTTPYIYAHGYVNTANRWRTIMAYNNACTALGFSCARIQYWSNPLVNYLGNPTGLAEGQANPADNHRTLNNTAFTVANFRNSNAKIYLAGLSASTNGYVYYTPNLNSWVYGNGILDQIVMGDFDGDGQVDDFAGITHNGTVWYTVNLGASWIQIPGILNRLAVGRFNNDSRDDLAGIASNGSLWYTTTLGSFTQIPGALSQIVIGDFDGDGQNNDIAGLASNNTIYYTTNLGASWANIPGALVQLRTAKLNSDNRTDLVGLAGNNAIYYTTNLSNFSVMPGLLRQLVTGDFDGNGLNNDIAGLASNNTIYYTTNLGVTWKNIPGLLTQLRAVNLDGDSRTDLAGLASNNTIWYTTTLNGWTNIPGQLTKLAGE